MYTPRRDVSPRGSVNTDTNIHPSIRPDDGISSTRRRIGDFSLMGCASTQKIASVRS